MSEQLKKTKKEKSPEEVAAQVARISDKLIERARKNWPEASIGGPEYSAMPARHLNMEGEHVRDELVVSREDESIPITNRPVTAITRGAGSKAGETNIEWIDRDDPKAMLHEPTRSKGLTIKTSRKGVLRRPHSEITAFEPVPKGIFGRPERVTTEADSTDISEVAEVLSQARGAVAEQEIAAVEAGRVLNSK